MKDFLTALFIIGWLILCSTSLELMNQGDEGFYLGLFSLVALMTFVPPVIVKRFFK